MLYTKTIGTGPDLVLLHGWGFNADLFEPLVARYQSHYRITVVDLPGHGRSQALAGGLQTWSDAIIKVLPKNPIILGWSLGGLLAIEIASKVSVSKLILLASTPKFVQDSDWKYGIDAEHFGQFSQALTLNPTKGIKRFVSLQTRDKSQLRDLNQAIEKLPATPGALAQGLEILLNTDLSAKLLTLTTEVQAILGEKDTLVPKKIQHWYQQHNIKTTLLNSGHIPFLDQDFSL